MKKLFAMILVLCMVCGVAALATDEPTATEPPRVYNQDNFKDTDVISHDTTITAIIGEVYTITIPTELNIDFNKPSTPLAIEVSGVHLSVPAPNCTKKICVQPVATSGDLTIKNTDKKIPYTVEIQNAETVDGNAALCFTGDATKFMNIVIAQKAWNAAAAGNYSGVLTFTVGVKDIENAGAATDPEEP